MPIQASLQSSTLNRSTVPARREQISPGAPLAEEAAVTDLASIVADLLARLESAEDTLAAIDALNVETRLTGAEDAIVALEATVADHETRITALEP